MTSTTKKSTPESEPRSSSPTSEPTHAFVIVRACGHYGAVYIDHAALLTEPEDWRDLVAVIKAFLAHRELALEVTEVVRCGGALRWLPLAEVSRVPEDMFRCTCGSGPSKHVQEGWHG